LAFIVFVAAVWRNEDEYINQIYYQLRPNVLLSILFLCQVIYNK